VGGDLREGHTFVVVEADAVVSGGPVPPLVQRGGQ